MSSAKPEKLLHRLFKHLSWVRTFNAAYGARVEVQTRVTKTDVCATALKETKVDPAKSVMVGDRAKVKLCGWVNHVQYFGESYGLSSAKELEDAGAKVLFDKPEAIPAGCAKCAK